MKSCCLSLLPLLAVSLSARGQVPLNLMIDGKMAGTAEYLYTNMANGGVAGYLKMDFRLAGAAMHGKVSFTYDKTGRPMAFSTSMSGQGVDESHRVEYRDRDVAITSVKDGVKLTDTVIIPKGRRIASQANLWFVKVRPNPGQSDKFWIYELDKAGWDETMIRYVGPTTMKIANRQVRAHELDEALGKFWVDDKGLPFKIKFKAGGSSFVFERAK